MKFLHLLRHELMQTVNICLSRLRACPGGDFAAFEMASLRRSTSAVKRDDSLQNDHENLDTSFSKRSHTRTYMIFRRLLNSLVNSLDFLMNLDRIRVCIHSISLQRPVRSVERPKAKGLFLKGAVFRLFICFIVGIFYGYTAIPSVDTSNNSASMDQVFAFHEDSANIEKRMILVGKDIIPIQKKMQKENIDLGIALNLQMENKTLNTSFSKISHDLELVSGKLLIVVTPTSGRPFQLYYLNRLAQTLRNLPAPFLWIVVEMQLQSAETSKLLRETGVMYRHLFCDKNVTCIKERSICQRNVALSHIEKHRLVGIVYFADVDKIYSVETFKEMREIRHFGTWPVALLSENKNRVILEGPVCNGSQVSGWHTNQRSRKLQRFHFDISRFAFNSTILWDTERFQRPVIDLIRQQDTIKEAFQESKFVELLVDDESQMEGLAEKCFKILVWHLHFEAP